ncbi:MULTISPECIES: hypothetical protein [unclassified Pseudoalteromonas]|uniref:hypothetical protein n=1 Tax=unclassified Pseudoalteromonas TaxID=194690 RepID=UPI0004000EA9|nr:MULTISPECIES: hypothetical protein [unclassified Pseudoalteromonas]
MFLFNLLFSTYVFIKSPIKAGIICISDTTMADEICPAINLGSPPENIVYAL